MLSDSEMLGRGACVGSRVRGRASVIDYPVSNLQLSSYDQLFSGVTTSSSLRRNSISTCCLHNKRGKCDRPGTRTDFDSRALIYKTFHSPRTQDQSCNESTAKHKRNCTSRLKTLAFFSLLMRICHFDRPGWETLRRYSKSCGSAACARVFTTEHCFWTANSNQIKTLRTQLGFHGKPIGCVCRGGE